MISRLLKKSLVLRRIARSWRLKNRQPDWRGLPHADSIPAGNPAAGGPGRKILIATSVGAHLPGTITESLLAAGLTVRGAEVHVLLCDGVLPACLDCTFATISERELALRGPGKHLCPDCFRSAGSMYRSLGIRIHRYGDFITPADRVIAAEHARCISPADIKAFRWNNLAVGEHALAGALRFYARGTIEESPWSDRVLRRYVEAALLTAMAMERMLGAYAYDCAVFHHGIYIPQGIIGEVCRSRGVRVVNWNPAYRKGCFIFSHDDTYHHTLMTEPVSAWENIPWDAERERELLAYLKSRWEGTNDWIWFHDRPRFDIAAIERELGIDFSRPTIGLLTNVFWDAQLHYPGNIFGTMLEWLFETISWFARHPSLQLVIRVHPAEITGSVPSRQPVIPEIRRRFPKMPPNVFCIGPESSMSTYAVMSRCNAVIIYGTKTGVELTSTGVPVIVAGEAWIRNKGITFDPASREEYYSVLSSLPFAERMSPQQVQRALRYAYHFFFRRMIPLGHLEQTGSWPPYRLALGTPDELLPGRYPGFDTVCNGILDAAPFIYPAERFEKRAHHA